MIKDTDEGSGTLMSFVRFRWFWEVDFVERNRDVLCVYFILFGNEEEIKKKGLNEMGFFSNFIVVFYLLFFKFF